MAEELSKRIEEKTEKKPSKIEEIKKEPEKVDPKKIPEELLKFLVDLPPVIEKDQLLELPIEHIKGISSELLKIKNTLDIATISDLSKLIPRSKVPILHISKLSEDELERWQSVASFIVKTIQGKVETTEKKKILVAGLDNAGKTALLNVLNKRFNIANLQPTKNVAVSQMTSANTTFNMWDMGGQDEYRKLYITHPERFFVNVHSVVYVVDVQDKAKFQLSISYFRKILDIMKSFSEFPDFMIFLHKADPNVYDQIQPELQVLENKFNEILKDNSFYYRILHTSIYNTLLTDSNVLSTLSNLFELSNRKDTPPELMESLQQVFDNFVSFSYLVEEKFQYYEQRLDYIENQNRNLMNSVSSSGVKITTPTQPRKDAAPLPPANARSELNKELKRLFRKRKMDTI